MSKEFILFENEEISFKTKFYRLMDLLVSNKTSSRLESVIFMGLFYLQMLSGFYASQIQVMDSNASISDGYLNYMYKIIRLKDLLSGNYSAFQIAIYLIFGLIIFCTLHYFILLIRITNQIFYTYNEFILNFFIKTLIYAAFNPILDLTLANLCFEDSNPNFPDLSCSLDDHAAVFIISLFLLLYSIFICFFINCFYNDSFFLSYSFFSRMNCSYEMYMTLNSIIYAILLSQAKYLGREIFLVYNFIISLIMLKFFFRKYLFYNELTNFIVGVFHILYTWTSFFFLIFGFITMNEKGIAYLIGCFIIVCLYYNLRHRLEEHIIMKTPFHKISNKFHLMFYLKSIINKIHNIDSNIEAKAELLGIIQHHQVECPNADCILKHKEKKIYLPITEEWSYRDKPEITDKVFLLNFMVILIQYFIEQCYYSPEMLINLSLYYLQIIGNFCQAMYYYKKVKEMKLNLQENFSFIRLNFTIRKSLVEKLRSSSEGCPILEDLNISLYFKYEDLSQKFFDEINNDINLSLEFWKSFKVHHETRRPLDFNKIFYLTDKIRLSKLKIENIWGDLFGTFSGVNDLFELYEDYVEQINDDDMLRRELETTKNKCINSAEHIQQNFYNILFNKETGIIIANGDKSKEGIIEKANDEIEKIFEMKSDELKGMNVSYLMPKVFEKIHKSFMERYFEIGEKRRLDKQFKSFAKDKENCIIPIQLIIKLFPMLNDNIYYCSMIIRENLDDLILIDSKFNIQGISRKLMTKFELENKNLFYDCDIPFYIICKEFINFYKNFLKRTIKKNKKDKNHSRKIQTSLMADLNKQKKLDELINSEIEGFDNIGSIGPMLIEPDNVNYLNDLNINQNVEINENIELEYEVCIPQFLHEYVSSINRRDDKTDVKLLKSTIHDNSRLDERENEITQGDYEENDNLVEPNTLENSPNAQPISPSNNRYNFSKHSDEDKEFQLKLKQYRQLFENGKYPELEELIDKSNNETLAKGYKFNFTFDKYRYGNGNIAYVIRCIDNKLEYEGTASINSIGDNELEKQKQFLHQKHKIEGLKEINEITLVEKQEVYDKATEYLKLCLEDRDFAKNLSSFKDEIALTSKVFGIKKEDANMEDENSSQSSQTSFNDNIAKKSRIEEIRSNLMQNVSNFYSLKWIKAIFYFMILITACFCGLYLMIFDLIYSDLNNISGLNTRLFQSSIWMTNTISSIISLRSLYNYKLNNFIIGYNSYIPDQNVYFDTLQVYSTTWYNEVMKIFGPIEQKINNYFNNFENQDIWAHQDVTYPTTRVNIEDDESYPLALAQVLSSTNELIKNDYFSINQTFTRSRNFTDHIKELINYTSFIAIENAIDNLIPRQYDFLKNAPAIFTQQNNGNMKFVIILILTYTFTVVILVIIYAILLYLTNKNMEEGLEKVSKIKLERIEETIKKIESFNDKCLSKYRQRENKLSEDIQEYKNDPGNTNTSKKGVFQKIFTEGQIYKRLRILSYSYLQIIFIIIVICSFLIPIYFVSLGMINSSNKILSVQNYIFGKCLTASTSTVNIKCVISQCKLAKKLDYNIQFTDNSQSIIRDISEFPELSDFFSNKFLLNACAVLYSPTLNVTKYNTCMNDIIVKSANNTDSLLKLIDETVSTIIKDREMKMNKPYTMINNKTTLFRDPFLFETKYFRDLEYIFYNYITPISDSFGNVVTLSLMNYLLTQRIFIIILICIFGISILIISFYIAFIFPKKLIHQLSVSRCILRIIPTSVINNTPEVETWIENKY